MAAGEGDMGAGREKGQREAQVGGRGGGGGKIKRKKKISPRVPSDWPSPLIGRQENQSNWLFSANQRP